MTLIDLITQTGKQNCVYLGAASRVIDSNYYLLLSGQLPKVFQTEANEPCYKKDLLRTFLQRREVAGCKFDAS